MGLQALGADLLHHALHRRVDAADGAVARLQERLQHLVAGASDGRHHAVGADGDDAVDLAEVDRFLAQLALLIAQDGVDDVADMAAVLRPPRLEAGRLVAGPHHDVGRGLDLRHLVAVLHALVAGEVEHLGAGGAQRAADREQHGVAEAAAGQQHGLAARRLRRMAGRAHEDDGIAGLQQRAEIGRAAHLQRDDRDEPALDIDPGPGHRQALHGERGAVDAMGERLEILQAVELAGLEVGRGLRRFHHDLDDGRRQARYRMHARAQASVQFDDEGIVVRGRPRRQLVQHARHHRPALLGARHRLHHVAGEGGMQVAEEADGAAVAAQALQHLDGLRLGQLLRLHGLAVVVDCLEVLAVETELLGIFARQHRVGTRARGDQHGPRRQASPRRWCRRAPAGWRRSGRVRRHRSRSASSLRRSGCPLRAPCRPPHD